MKLELPRHIDVLTLLENTVAIADGFYSNREQSRQFYDHHAVALGGFPGIWRFVGEAAFNFTVWEHSIDWHGNWIEAVEAYADGLLTCDKLPDLRAQIAIFNTVVERFDGRRCYP